MRVVLLACVLALSACGSAERDRGTSKISGAREVPLAHAKTFKVYERDGYRIVDIEASVVAWGGSSGGPPQRARLVLVPPEATPPTLTGDLAGATLIRTPVQRIAVNDQPHEAMVRALGLSNRLVAVGGHQSYDDAIRVRVRAGQIHQIGYGWHQPPTLDALVKSRPDVLLTRMADLTHTKHTERVQGLGIPVVPIFMDAEPHYLGKSEWVRLLGMLTGKEREAEAFMAEVSREVDRLKRLAAAQPRRSYLFAWYQSSGDRWAVTQRNADAALIRDANATVVLGAPDNPELDSFSYLSTERLLQGGTNADCWMIRDPLSNANTNYRLLARFKAYRDRCVFAQHGAKNPRTDGWELWEMGTIRPDWMLSDVIKIVHPQLRDGRWRYHEPEDFRSAHAGAGNH